MSDEVPPWTDLDELLDAERQISPLRADAMDRVTRRLGATLPVGVMGGAGGGHGAGGSGTQSAPPPAGGEGTWALRRLAGLKLGGALAAFVVGALAGVVGHATWAETRSSAPLAPPSAPATPAASTSTAATATLEADRAGVAPPSPSATLDPVAPKAAPLRDASAGASARPTSSAEVEGGGRVDGALRAERALLERARTAITRGDPAAALEALRAHRARFPRGQLGEERDALEVTAIGMRGDAGAARDAAKRFRKEHPDSLLGDDLPR